MTELKGNRKEKFEMKRIRIVDLTTKGATVGEIAKDLGLTERDVYTFITRNFGGVQKLRDACNGGMLTVDNVNDDAVIDATPKQTPTKKVQGVKSATKQTSTGLFIKEKERVLSEFKASLEKDMKAILAETKKTLDASKQQLVNQFKADIEKDIKNAYK